ncbi:metallophosphoesterase family protein [Haliangium ochraceum]|uniref:Phosphoesterase n=1 Tax=Haliangium ochraceum (strain DSM 14365 / JCM 11303 / SMP-2) TaxID=502025 RepID=D0LR62_HALO1|nr:metallophosphoesterase family protein [Haliangium ochraceum]ACY15570.1 phosphodiesterase, MJ0936 family [Haliangium ochraceum DSM 14365]
MSKRRPAASFARSASASIPLRADGSIVLGVVADTHSRPHPATADLLRARAPDAILHAGDIGDLEVLERLAEVAPVHAVRGNIDARAPELPDQLTIDLVGDEGRALRILLVHIAVYGPRLRTDIVRIARDAKAELVVCGHSHVPFIGEDRGLTVFNPGSVGPRRFALPIVFGMLRLGAGGLQLEHLSCETGATWLPP